MYIYKDKQTDRHLDSYRHVDSLDTLDYILTGDITCFRFLGDRTIALCLLPTFL